MRDESSSGSILILIVAILLALVCTAVLLQWDVVVMGSGSFAGEMAVPYPPVLVLIGLVLVTAFMGWGVRARVLTRGQLLGVLYAMLIGIPLMTQGFWHRFASITATLPQQPATFAMLDAYPSQLWPHGPNVLAGAFAPEAGKSPGDSPGRGVTLTGNAQRTQVRLATDKTRPGVVMTNTKAGEVSALRVRIPLRGPEGAVRIQPGEQNLVSVLARPGKKPNFALVGTHSEYYLRVYIDDTKQFVDVFSTHRSGEQTFLQPAGFVRLGGQSMRVPASAKDSITVEYGLKGPGTLRLADPQMMNISAMTQLKGGRRWVTQSVYDELPIGERAGLIVRPDQMWSLAGAKFLLTAYVPWGQWALPLAAWGSFLLLLLTGTLAMSVLLRRQWIDSERYGLPMARIPLTLMGSDAAAGGAAPELADKTGLPAVYRNPLAWIGFGVALLYTLARAIHFYNPQFPDLTISVPLAPFFEDPAYGKMWEGVTFSVSLVFLSIAMYMELSVLLSIVLGFFLYRSLFWMGKAFGFVQIPAYPWPSQQQTAAYLVYAGVILMLARRHIWRVIRSSFTADKQVWRDELMSYPMALGLLAGCGVLSMVWAAWVGVSLTGMALFCGYLLVVALVAARLRCEAGVPFTYLGPTNATAILAMLGGFTAFGPRAMLFTTVVSFMVGPTPFFFIPGAQMELVAIGQRMKLRARHVVTASTLGVVGGILIGGWVFLGGAYGHGGDEMQYAWAFSNKAWYFTDFKQQLNTATATTVTSDAAGGAAASPAMPGGGEGIDPSIWGYAIGGGATALVAVLRQLMPGFWFHPIGVLLGSNWLSTIIWGSCLVAWVLRLAVLKIGGAAMVRNRLQPLFVGVFVGAIMGHMIHLIYAAIFLAGAGESYFTWSGLNLP